MNFPEGFFDKMKFPIHGVSLDVDLVEEFPMCDQVDSSGEGWRRERVGAIRARSAINGPFDTLEHGRYLRLWPRG